jgi:uridine kinase
MAEVADDELGPVLEAPAAYFELRTLVRVALGFPKKRKPLLIGIDGVDGSGKSPLAAWLSWQLQMPAIYLDMYWIRDTAPQEFRHGDLARAVDARLSQGTPLIIEGILLLRVLNEIGRSPDFLVFVDKESHAGSIAEIKPYFDRYKPQTRANYTLRWSSAEHDARVDAAHLRLLDRADTEPEN